MKFGINFQKAFKLWQLKKFFKTFLSLAVSATHTQWMREVFSLLLIIFRLHPIKSHKEKGRRDKRNIDDRKFCCLSFIFRKANIVIRTSRRRVVVGGKGWNVHEIYEWDPRKAHAKNNLIIALRKIIIIIFLDNSYYCCHKFMNNNQQATHEWESLLLLFLRKKPKI